MIANEFGDQPFRGPQPWRPMEHRGRRFHDRRLGEVLPTLQRQRAVANHEVLRRHGDDRAAAAKEKKLHFVRQAHRREEAAASARKCAQTRQFDEAAKALTARRDMRGPRRPGPHVPLLPQQPQHGGAAGRSPSPGARDGSTSPAMSTATRTAKSRAQSQMLMDDDYEVIVASARPPPVQGHYGHLLSQVTPLERAQQQHKRDSVNHQFNVSGGATTHLPPIAMPRVQLSREGRQRGDDTHGV